MWRLVRPGNVTSAVRLWRAGTCRIGLVRGFAEFSNEYPWQWTPGEVEAFFDAADALADEIRVRRRKGVLPAMRDAAILKTVYAFGLRASKPVAACPGWPTGCPS